MLHVKRESGAARVVPVSLPLRGSSQHRSWGLHWGEEIPVKKIKLSGVRRQFVTRNDTTGKEVNCYLSSPGPPEARAIPVSLSSRGSS